MGSDGCTSPPPLGVGVGVGVAVGEGVDDGSPDGVGVGECATCPWILILGPCPVSLLAKTVRFPPVRSRSDTIDPDRATRSVRSRCIECARPRETLPRVVHPDGAFAPVIRISCQPEPVRRTSILCFGPRT